MTRRERTVAAMALPILLVAAVSGSRAQEIEFSVMESGTYDVAAREITEAFAEESGIEVAISAFPWAVLRQTNTTDLISGTHRFDVMSGGYYLADVYPYFASLEAYIEADAYGEGMIDNLMSPGRSEFVDGAQIGIPYGIDAYGLIYNTAVLDAAGIAPEFATWSDVVAACETIEKSTDVACLSHPTGSPEQIGAFFFSAYPGTYVTADGRYALETDAAVAAAREIVELWPYLPENGTAMSFDEAHQAFIDGDAAMLVTWPSFVSNTLDAEDSPVRGSWSMASFPGEGFPWLSLWQLFVPEASENKDAAWRWITAYAGPENATRNLLEHNIGSVWKATYEDEAVAAPRSHYLAQLLEGFARAKNPPLSGEAQDFLTNTLQDIANARVSPEEGIEAINAAWETIPVPPALLEAAAGSALQAR